MDELRLGVKERKTVSDLEDSFLNLERGEATAERSSAPEKRERRERRENEPPSRPSQLRRELLLAELKRGSRRGRR